MKILVLNGSPSGQNSITLQTVEYIKILYPDHEYTTLHVGQRIKVYEKDFSEARKALKEAELIIFAYPVYTFLVPSQLHRFIELIKENGVSVAGKYATQIATSKHFYDITAFRFIEDNCSDLGLNCLEGFSADMEDLLTEKGQKEARDFFSFVLWNIEQGFSKKTGNTGAPVRFEPVIADMDSTYKTQSEFTVSLVTDFDPEHPDPALLAMIGRFKNSVSGECRVFNLRELRIDGGCLGCFHCASNGECIYKDKFDKYLRDQIQKTGLIVYAFSIKDHSMGYRMKLYDDRQFANGHRTVTMGQPVAYLVNGNLSEEQNLRTLMEARAQVGGNYLAGIATDEKDPDREIDQLVRTLEYAVMHNYQQPKNFYGTGGLKIFRDLIFQMQGMMREDHRFYKKNGFYNDFPQKHRGRILAMYAVGALMKNPRLMSKSKITMTDGMLMPYRKVLEKAEGK